MQGCIGHRSPIAPPDTLCPAPRRSTGKPVALGALQGFITDSAAGAAALATAGPECQGGAP